MSSKIRLDGLDAIKAIAIILVVGFHYFGQLTGWHMNLTNSQWLFGYFQDFTWSKLLHFVESYGYVGVNLFVIASGLGLYLSHLNRGVVFNFLAFCKKRIWRLMPGAIIGTIFVFFFKWILLDNLALREFWVNFSPYLGGLNLFSDSWFFPPINGETWFLGLMVQLYLMFPALLYLRKKIGLNGMLAICMIITFGFRLGYYYWFHDAWSTSSYGFGLARLADFGFGMYLAEKITKKEEISSAWILGIVFALGYFFSITYFASDFLFGAGVFVLLWKIFLNSESSGILKNISKQSYLIFLIHHPLIWLLDWKLGIKAWSMIGVLGFFGVFAVSYGIAYTLNKIEIKKRA